MKYTLSGAVCLLFIWSHACKPGTLQRPQSGDGPSGGVDGSFLGDASQCTRPPCLNTSDTPCTRTLPAGVFSPKVQCRWSGPPLQDAYPTHKNVLSTTMVVDFNFDNDPTTHRPSIVFISYDREDGGLESAQCDQGAFGIIRIIDGETCAQQHSVTGIKVRGSSALALGDLDGDKRADITALRCGGGIVALGYDALTQQFRQLWIGATPNNEDASVAGWDGPSIHDIDNDGYPEVLRGGYVWSHTGGLIDASLGPLQVGAGTFAVVADLNGDGAVELTNGQGVWTWHANTWTIRASDMGTAGHVAVADFGTYPLDSTVDQRGHLDGIAEIVVVAAGTVRIQTQTGRLVFGPVALPGGGYGGPPNIADFDNDGRAEFSTVGAKAFTVFDPDMQPGGILWSQSAQDESSSATGSSVFDFNGDGLAEAVYADECFLRVYDGQSGDVYYSQTRTSSTWYENPVIADVDGDYRAEIVVGYKGGEALLPYCRSRPQYQRDLVSGMVLDNVFKGLHCQTSQDCESGRCDAGFCRCSQQHDCGDNFVCTTPLPGTPGTGQVCRAALQRVARGVAVLSDSLDRWASSRRIWNQHAYSVTNVAEDGTIPKTSDWQLNWRHKGYNHFRQNTQGEISATAAADVLMQPRDIPPCYGTMKLIAAICNQGTLPVDKNTSVAFYLGDPANKKRLCVTQNKSILKAGACEEISCLWPHASTAPVTIIGVADDDGSGQGRIRECRETNNHIQLPAVHCTALDAP